MNTFLQRIADAKDVTDLVDCELSEVGLMDATPSPVAVPLLRVRIVFMIHITQTHFFGFIPLSSSLSSLHISIITANR